MWQFGIGVVVGGGLVFCCYHYGNKTLQLGRDLLAKVEGDHPKATALLRKL